MVYLRHHRQRQTRHNQGQRQGRGGLGTTGRLEGGRGLHANYRPGHIRFAGPRPEERRSLQEHPREAARLNLRVATEPQRLSSFGGADLFNQQTRWDRRQCYRLRPRCSRQFCSFSTCLVIRMGALPEARFGSANLRVHLPLKVSQRPLTDLEKSVPRAVNVLNQKYDRRKGKDYCHGYERPFASGQSGVIAKGRRSKSGNYVKHNPDDIWDTELQSHYHPSRVQGDDFVQWLNEICGKIRG